MTHAGCLASRCDMGGGAVGSVLRCTFCVQNTPYTRVVWLCSCTDVAHQVLLELTRRNQLEEDGFRSCVQVPSSGIVQDKEENWKSGFPESGAESCCVLELRGCLAEGTAAKESLDSPLCPTHACQLSWGEPHGTGRGQREVWGCPTVWRRGCWCWHMALLSAICLN